MAFNLPDLPYAHDALEPVIDAKTMEIHHGKHHSGYVSKLNTAVEGTEFAEQSLEQLMAGVGRIPSDKQKAVRNNGGGHYNHSLFWPTLAPPGKGGGGQPSGELAEAINSAFGGFDRFKDQFATAAAGRFGSGWAWLILQDGRLAITDTKNQDNPLMQGLSDYEGEHGTPILGLDVWEHAYYLKYQNRRPDYIAAWWDAVNWDQVARNYADAR